jgi:hypothetical protein
MAEPSRRRDKIVLRCAIAGAVLLFTAVVIVFGRGYEGGDAVVVLGPLALVVGALVGAACGSVIRLVLQYRRAQ